MKVYGYLFQGLETTPRTSTSHLASDPKRRPSSAQPRTKLSMATCPGQRTMEATRGNGYAPAWGSLVMMMMM